MKNYVNLSFNSPHAQSADYLAGCAFFAIFPDRIIFYVYDIT